jgi:hypothetical protein
MTEEKQERQSRERDDEQARLKRPEDEVEDLEAPPDEADKTRGGGAWWNKEESKGPDE